uniref:XPG-I domain-containing protein n=1 Tax=Chromera velia CCMP2878 TaxID=1169474 RepID=A0A0G4HKW6_9ALVE|eukprot:Cvel_28611.t1-p1 / transcript=Cvel_28611.t1 / gene=Cvel_28611 / organism=Chromera_velia_CCMP2878 / gene_product=DNA repair protein UVH3, putative / transcript_product=DNA repair protein UVH3, putative / location=Cvel_scaffold3775:236-3539(+) / protein_length=613 / sequence_SO=supercontig / SO=protein_coding / is_pseudo=false
MGGFICVCRRAVERYSLQGIHEGLGCGPSELCLLAMCLGCDYSVGVRGVGIVNGLEAVRAFRTLEGMREWRQWAEAFRLRGVAEKDNDPVRKAYKESHKNYKLQMTFPDDFPSVEVWNCLNTPVVDNSTERFSWAPPDKESIIRVMSSITGMTEEDVEQQLDPVIQAQQRQPLVQPRIDAFLHLQPNPMGPDASGTDDQVAKIRSRRMAAAVHSLRNRQRAGVRGRGAGGKGRGRGRGRGGREGPEDGEENEGGREEEEAAVPPASSSSSSAAAAVSGSGRGLGRGTEGRSGAKKSLRREAPAQRAGEFPPAIVDSSDEESLHEGSCVQAGEEIREGGEEGNEHLSLDQEGEGEKEEGEDLLGPQLEALLAEQPQQKASGRGKGGTRRGGAGRVGKKDADARGRALGDSKGGLPSSAVAAETSTQTESKERGRGRGRGKGRGGGGRKGAQEDPNGKAMTKGGNGKAAAKKKPKASAGSASVSASSASASLSSAQLHTGCTEAIDLTEDAIDEQENPIINSRDNPTVAAIGGEGAREIQKEQEGVERKDKEESFGRGRARARSEVELEVEVDGTGEKDDGIEHDAVDERNAEEECNEEDEDDLFDAAMESEEDE